MQNAKKTQIQNKMKELITKINHWNHLYYEKSESQVSDQVYDQHFQELKYLEKKYPEWSFPNTPTKKVGSNNLNTFTKIEHHQPMLSLNNAFNQKDLYAFDKRVSKFTNGNHTYYCEPKIDGLPVSLIFKNGYFTTSATRGNGIVGENVTENVKTITGIKINLFRKQKFNNFDIRGEVFFSKNNFQDLNLDLLEKKTKEFWNKTNNKKQELKNLIIQKFPDYKVFFDNNLVSSFDNNRDIIVHDNTVLLLKELKQLKKKIFLNFIIFFPQNNDFSVQENISFFKEQTKFFFQNTSVENNVLKIYLNFCINFINNQFSNPRNAASGSLKQLDSKITNERNLSVIFYNLISLDKKEIFFQNEIIDNLKKMNFPFSVHNKSCETIEDVFQYIKYIEKHRDQIPYDTDGIVIKVNEHKFYSLIGRTERAPGYWIAYKYPSKQAETKIIDIFPTVGRTGRVTYNAKLKKIFLSGTYVSAVTLHNAEYIEKKDIRIGDFVFIKKAGEIIPKVFNVNKKKRMSQTQQWQRDQICPFCKSNLFIFEKEVDQYCVNEKCPEKKLKSFVHFASRDAMNIVGLNKNTIKTLINLDFLNDFTDIYRLKEKYSLILNLSKTDKLQRLGFKSIDNLLKAIDKTKNNSLERFLFSLNIRHVGIKVAKLLAKNFENIDNLFSITSSKLNEIEGFGPILAQSIVNYFFNKKNILLILSLQKLGINTKYHFKIFNNNFFSNKKVVITGVFEWSRKKLIDKLEMSNAVVLSSISSNVDFLLVGSKPGSKLEKAKELNINLIFDEDLKRIFT